MYHILQLPLSIIISHFAFAMGLFIIAMVFTRWILMRADVMDVPNARSAHIKPIPKSGGVSIVCTFLLGVVIIYFFADTSVVRQVYF